MDHSRSSVRRVVAVVLTATATAVAALLAATIPVDANFAIPGDTAFDVYTHHPLWRGSGAPRPPPALVRYYGVKLEASRPGRRYTRSSRYLPKGSRFRRASDKFPYPILEGDADVDKFVGWDLLRLPYYGLDVYDWAHVALHRDARLCLALGDRLQPWLRLPGYEREGVAILPAGAGVTIDGGPPPNRVSLFCKEVSAGIVTLPRASRLGIPGRFGYDIILAEKGGVRPVRQPPPPGVRDIYPNTRCPDGLHELWRTGAHDSSDADTRGKTWRTWHPQVDPIYWCYYGHDHGTAPQFQSVPPRFGYTAWKNGRQDESHIGFKGYGFWSGPDKYYITSHIDTTLVRRVRERFHTVTLAATSPSGETVADLSCKGDFGFTFALAANFRTNPTNILTVGGQSQQRLYNEVAKIPFKQRPKNAKRVNVWSGGPDTDRSIDLTDLPRGRYEVWEGGLGMCTTSAHKRGMTVDIKDSLTACATRECPVWAPLTRLAPVVDFSQGVFTPNRALRRDALFDSVVINREQCGLDGDARRGSVFYTDPFCKELRPGPGPNSVRQVLKPGWKGFLGGKYGSVESWYGMYQQVAAFDEDGGFENIEMGVSEWN